MVGAPVDGPAHVLTDLRIVRLSGVFTIDVFDCALRKVADTRVSRDFRELPVGALGSIEISPRPTGARPRCGRP